MNKNMRYIKFAFAALFFTLTAQVFTLSTDEGGVPSLRKVSTPAIVEASTQSADESLKTTSLARAVELVKAQDQQAQEAAQKAAAEKQTVTAKLVSFKGKSYQYKLSIPALKVNAGVLGMGIDPKDGRMMVPNNYTEVGWYNLGGKPGEKGSAVMGAHVDNGSSINGVFKNLKNLKVGNIIYVTDGNGIQYTYKVTARKVYGYKTAVTSDVFLKNDTERLNLITCYGTWLPKENTYDRRLVVYAELQKKTLTQR